MDAPTLIAEILRKDKMVLSDDIQLSEIDGWDSLKGVRLVLRLEQIVGHELSESDIEKLMSVGDIDQVLSNV